MRRICILLLALVLTVTPTMRVAAAETGSISGMDKTLSVEEVTITEHDVVIDTFDGINAYSDVDRNNCWTNWTCENLAIRYYMSHYSVDLTTFFENPYSGYEDSRISVNVTYDPQPGDIAYAYGTDRPHTSYYHVALIKEVGDGTLTLIEQNMGAWYADADSATVWTNRVIPWAASADSEWGEYYNTYYVFRVTVKETNTAFTDVPDTHWAAEAITTMYEAGIFSGTTETTFEPSAQITRAEFATLLSRMNETCGGPVPAANFEDTVPSFPDVADTDWYYEAAVWAYQNGIIDPDGDGAFCPDDSLSRQDMLLLLSRFLQKAGVNLADSESSLAAFADEAAACAYAENYAASIVKFNLLSPYYQKLQSNYLPSRAETAQVLYEAWKLLLA